MTEPHHEKRRHDPMPGRLAILTTIMVALLLVAVFVVDIPERNRDLVFLVVGNVMGAWTASMSVFTGATAPSAAQRAPVVLPK